MIIERTVEEIGSRRNMLPKLGLYCKHTDNRIEVVPEGEEKINSWIKVVGIGFMILKSKHFNKKNYLFTAS